MNLLTHVLKVYVCLTDTYYMSLTFCHLCIHFSQAAILLYAFFSSLCIFSSSLFFTEALLCWTSSSLSCLHLVIAFSLFVLVNFLYLCEVCATFPCFTFHKFYYLHLCLSATERNTSFLVCGDGRHRPTHTVLSSCQKLVIHKHSYF